MKSIELFAGAGGLALGLERAGFNSIGLIEIDKDAAETLKLNRPQWKIFNEDISKISPLDLEKIFGGGILMKKIFLCVMMLSIIFCSADKIFAEKISDYEQINQLIIGERFYRVTHRNSEHKNCFFDDATIRTSWQSGNVSTFVGNRPAESAGEDFNVNRCGGALIHLKKNRAFVEYPSTTIRTVKVNGEKAILKSYMRLLYRVEKKFGEWKISEMISINEADELQPLIPGTNLKINPEEVKKFRSSYRWLAYVRKNNGGEISENLLGVDRAEEVQKIYDEILTWLNKN